MNSKLVLGTAQIGLDYGINNSKGLVSIKETERIFNVAHENGIQILDTAEAYGYSHEKIGRYHNKSNNKFRIITKLNSKKTSFSTGITDKVYENLKTLNVDSLYAYMFHSFEDFKKHFTKYYEDLLILKEKGVIEKIGVSLYANDDLDNVLKFNNVDLVQLPFNLLDNNNKRGKIIKKAKAAGIEIHTRSVFLQGLFFADTNKLTHPFNKLSPYLKSLQNLCCQDFKINELALNYACNNTDIDKVLLGVDNANQLKLNLLCEKKGLREELRKRVDLINVKENKLLNPSNW